ncbi:MAG TPA: MgtC/SapB family protein [Pseudolabrys sp.]|nr:MgtC/SapB family protein [Pseudolabrys sp.]
MPLHLTWIDLLVRLGSTVLAGAIIGLNRTEHGKAAGLRTTLLVCLAASIAMLQVNYLLPLAGRPSDSFVMNDLMRLPLGILTGVGFIGAGAILRRNELVVGVTTAATLWYVTVVGLCFGGGQVLLGWIATAIGWLVLWGLARLEIRMAVEFRYRLSLTLNGPTVPESEIRRQLYESGLKIKDVNIAAEGNRCRYVYDVIFVRPRGTPEIPGVVQTFTARKDIAAVQWREIG